MKGRPGKRESISEEHVATALGALRARVARAIAERERLDHEVAAAEEELHLLERLLALRRAGAAQTGTDVGVQEESQGTKAIARGMGQPLLQAVVEELALAGRPVHISDLMRLLRERRVPIPGSGTQANLITYLRRDDRLVRPSRGMYGLAAWGLENVGFPRRSRSRRKRVRATASNGRNGR